MHIKRFGALHEGLLVIVRQFNHILRSIFLPTVRPWMAILVVWFFSLFAPLTTIVHCQVLSPRESQPLLLTSVFVAHTNQHVHPLLGAGVSCQQARPSSTATSQWPPISALPRILHDLLVLLVAFSIILTACRWAFSTIAHQHPRLALAPPTPPPRLQS